MKAVNAYYRKHKMLEGCPRAEVKTVKASMSQDWRTSTITFITIQPCWTAPESSGISSALAVRCGGSLAAFVLKMICPSLPTPSCTARGHFLHYGAWLGTEQQHSYKEQLRLAINEALAKCPTDFDAFLQLMEASSCTLKHGRGEKVYNLKQMAALQFMQEQNITEYDQLSAKAEDAVSCFHTLTEQLRQTEVNLSMTLELMGALVQYAKTRPEFDGYKAAKYSRKYLAEHEVELADYRAAKATMGELLGGEKRQS